MESYGDVNRTGPEGGLNPGVPGSGSGFRSLGDVESWRHVGGAGSRVRSADSERARAAGGGAAAAGEERDRVGTVGGRCEEGDTCVRLGRHGDAEGSPGGAGPVRRLGFGTGRRAPKS